MYMYVDISYFVEFCIYIPWVYFIYNAIVLMINEVMFLSLAQADKLSACTYMYAFYKANL